MSNIYPKDFVLFAGWYPEHLDMAKDWIKERGYTSDDVRIVRLENEQLLIKTKKETTL